MYELLTTKQIETDISNKVKSLRLKLNKTQESFAKSIGISKATYMRFENGGSGSFENFILIMQGLGRIHELENILKLESYSPLEAVKKSKKTSPRLRASSTKDNKTTHIVKKEEKSFLEKIKESRNG